MEPRTTRNDSRQTSYFDSEARQNNFDFTLQRLDSYFETDQKNAGDKPIFYVFDKNLEAAVIKKPVAAVQAFKNFGLILGTFAPAAIFLRAFMNANALRGEDLWILGVLAIVNLVTAVSGYLSGKLIYKLTAKAENLSWSLYLLLLPLIGILWGIISGSAGGAVILLFGAIFGAAMGAMVGAVALPLFAVLVRLIKNGDYVENKYFLPAAFGTAFTICGFILGL